MKTVFVGLSGGVDSSVAALKLKESGYRVVGVYMKNWSKDLPGFECPWKEDYLDAKRLAVQLGIEFELFDFETEYFDKVVNYMLDEYKIGRTPNPDIMCNQEIKFKLFLDASIDKGADYIATGHYAGTSNGKLYTAVDQSKDQTYFLYRIKEQALLKTLFPLANITKSEVRQIASKANLITASKKESMGICFVGKVGIKDFLKQYINTEPGPIVDQYNQVIGQHDGAIFYTIGQRHGLGLGGGLPMYVTGKDMAKNTVFVTTKIDNDNLWRQEINITNSHWINTVPDHDTTYYFRTRHRAPLVKGKFKDQKLISILLEDPIRAITPGQSVVVYSDNLVLGGAIIN
jgi:tRNA-specific 2-thiouridylase